MTGDVCVGAASKQEVGTSTVPKPYHVYCSCISIYRISISISISYCIPHFLYSMTSPPFLFVSLIHGME